MVGRWLWVWGHGFCVCDVLVWKTLAMDDREGGDRPHALDVPLWDAACSLAIGLFWWGSG